MKYFLSLFLLSNISFAQSFCDGISPTEILQAQSKSEYCAKSALNFAKIFCSKYSRIGLENEGGLFGLPTGICWWHSEFNRKAIYLSYFNPTDKRPIQSEEMAKIIRDIHHFKIVEIRGYSTFYDFIMDPKFTERPIVLQKFLQNVMLADTVKLNFLRNIDGRPNRLRESIGVYKDGKYEVNRYLSDGVKKEERFDLKMDRQRVNQLKEIAEIISNLNSKSPRIPYVFLQLPSIPAHAFNVYEAIEFIDDQNLKSYKIKVLDSNYQELKDEIQTYIFDHETAQWYSEYQHSKLVQKRKSKVDFEVVREWTSSPVSSRPDAIVAQGFTLHVQENRNLVKINQTFKSICGKTLFKDLKRR